MGFDSFEDAGRFKVKCKTCGEVVPTGICSLSEHWNNCTGKGFKESLIERRTELGKLTINDVEELMDKLNEA